jgi:gliding motility-associated-like protein
VTGGRGYTIVDLKNNAFNHILTIPQISFPFDFSFYRDRAFVLDIFADRVVSFDFEQNLFFNDPSWSFINPIASRYRTTSISMLGDCGSPQDFVIYKRERLLSDELHYTSSPDFVNDVICKVGSRINDNEVVRAIPYPLILDLDDSMDYCESNDTIISLTLCSDNRISLEDLNPYLEEYDDHIDSMTIDIVDGPASVTIDYNTGRLDKNTVSPLSLVLSDTGSSTIQDFGDAITSLSIENIPTDVTSRIEIEFQLFSYIRQSLPATVVIELTQEDTYAGRDTSLVFCPDETAVDLNDFLDMDANPGIWPTGNIYDPSTATLSDVLYIVEGQVCANDTAVYGIQLYPEAFMMSERISFCAGDSVLYQGRYYSQNIDLVDTMISVVTGCDSLYRNIEIRDYDMPIEVQLDTTICAGASIVFLGQVLDTSGVYRDTLQNAAACDSIIVELSLTMQAPITEIDIDTQLCVGNVLTILGQTYTEAVFEQIIVPDSQGCDSIILNIILEYEENITLPDQSFEITPSIPTQISIDYDLDYDRITWMPEEGLNCTDCLDPIVALDQDATYQLQINPVGSCAEIINVQFFVIEEEKEYYLPNVFSISDPGNNKFYLQSSSGNFTTYSLSIYDRWGSQVFLAEDIQANEASVGWNGSAYSGQELSQGVYVYKIVLEDGSILSGDILMLK